MKPEHEHTIDCVMSRFSYSRDTFSSFHMNCVRNYNHYRMWNTGSYQTHRNNIVVPLIFSMVWADIARKISTSYPSNQIIDVFGYGPEDRPAAEKNRVLLNSQLKDTRMFTKAINVLANGDICGAGIAQLSWKNEERVEFWMSILGMVVERSTPSPISTWYLKALPLLNCSSST